MARFEVTLAGGEKILVDHSAATMQEMLQELTGSDFMLFNEVKGGSVAPVREVIIATRQLTLVRPLGDNEFQGSDFRRKR